jgi:hypothetical protein
VRRWLPEDSDTTTWTWAGSGRQTPSVGNPGAVLRTPGTAVTNCVTACFAAIGRGWNLIP